MRDATRPELPFHMLNLCRSEFWPVLVQRAKKLLTFDASSNNFAFCYGSGVKTRSRAISPALSADIQADFIAPSLANAVGDLPLPFTNLFPDRASKAGGVALFPRRRLSRFGPTFAIRFLRLSRVQL